MTPPPGPHVSPPVRHPDGALHPSPLGAGWEYWTPGTAPAGRPQRPHLPPAPARAVGEAMTGPATGAQWLSVAMHTAVAAPAAGVPLARLAESTATPTRRGDRAAPAELDHRAALDARSGNGRRGTTGRHNLTAVVAGE